MKITIDQSNAHDETEVVIRCKDMDEEVLRLLARIRIQDKKITGMKRGTIFILDIRSILYFESVDNQTFIYTEHETYESNLKLYEVESSLDRDDFIRISKSVVVNFRHITEISPLFNGRLEISLTNKEKIEVSKNYAPAIKDKLLK
jgi:DNA-binding LytR/AlgR family response regulator